MYILCSKHIKFIFCTLNICSECLILKHFVENGTKRNVSNIFSFISGSDVVDQSDTEPGVQQEASNRC